MCVHMCIQRVGERKDLLRELVHLVMEADKSHDRLSARLRTREPGSVTHSLSMGSDPWEADGETLRLRPPGTRVWGVAYVRLRFQRRT